MCCASKKNRLSLHSNLHVNNQLPPWLSSTQDNLTLDLTWIHMYPSEQMKLPEFVVCQFHLVAVSWTIACQSLIRSRQVKSTSPKSREVKQKCAEASLNKPSIYKSWSVGCVTAFILNQMKCTFHENSSCSLLVSQADHSLHGKHKLRP